MCLSEQYQSLKRRKGDRVSWRRLNFTSTTGLGMCIYCSVDLVKRRKKQLNQPVNLQFIFIYLTTQHHVIWRLDIPLFPPHLSRSLDIATMQKCLKNSCEFRGGLAATDSTVHHGPSSRKLAKARASDCSQASSSSSALRFFLSQTDSQASSPIGLNCYGITSHLPSHH